MKRADAIAGTLKKGGNSMADLSRMRDSAGLSKRLQPRRANGSGTSNKNPDSRCWQGSLKR
jgi:hypothetical protein